MTQGKLKLIKSPLASVNSTSYHEEALNNYMGTDKIAKLKLEHGYLLEGLLPAGGYLHLYGKEKAGKTRLLWQLAHSVAVSGKPWMGFIVNKTGPVLWLEVDMGTAEFQYVLHNAEAAGLAPCEDIVAVAKHHYLDALNPTDQDLLYTLSVLYKPVLTVIDTFTDCYVGELENETIRRVVAAFRFSIPDSAFVFGNHERRTSQALIAKGKEDSDAELGGGELSRKASGVLRLVRQEGDSHGTLKLMRTRTQRFWSELGLKLDDHGFWKIDTGHLTPRMLVSLWPDIPGLSIEEAKSCKSVDAVLQTLHDNLGVELPKLQEAFSQIHGQLPWQRWLGLL